MIFGLGIAIVLLWWYAIKLTLGKGMYWRVLIVLLLIWCVVYYVYSYDGWLPRIW